MTDPFLSSEPEQRARRRPADPDYHDPTGGLLGAPPAHSALDLRLALAAFGLVVCAAAAVAFAVAGVVVLTVVLAVLAVVALADMVVVLRRRRARG